MKGRHIQPDFNPDTMNWTRANMSGTLVPAARLEKIRDQAWEELNKPDFKAYKKTMLVGNRTGSSTVECGHSGEMDGRPSAISSH